MLTLENAVTALNFASNVIAAAAIAAAFTPSPKDDEIIAKLRKVIDFLAFNFGNAKNK